MFCPLCDDELRTESDISAHKFGCADDDEGVWETIKRLDDALSEMLPSSQYVITIEREENHG